MNTPDLEARLRKLRLADPAGTLPSRILAEAALTLRLRRQLRMALGAAAAAALMAIGAGLGCPAPSGRTIRLPDPGVAEILAGDPALARRARLLAWIPPRPGPDRRGIPRSLTLGDPP